RHRRRVLRRARARRRLDAGRLAGARGPGSPLAPRGASAPRAPPSPPLASLGLGHAALACSARSLHRVGGMPIRYHSQAVKEETLHTVSLVAPHLDRGMSVLDVGCGEGYVGEELCARGVKEAWGVDIVDL